MRLNKYSYSSEQKQKISINPVYFIIPGIFLIVFVTVGILLIGVSQNKSKTKKTTEESTVTANTDEDYIEILDYKDYRGLIEDAFSDKYGYNFNIEIEPSENNAYFLDGLMKEIAEGGEIGISGAIVGSGICGEITPYNNASCYENFAFSDKMSLLHYDYSEYLKEGDTRLEGLPKNVDLGYTLTGTEELEKIKKTLLESKYSDEKEDNGEFTVTYKEGALKGEGAFFEKFLKYPGDLELSVYTEVTDNNRLNVNITGNGAVNFQIVLSEVRGIGETDTSLIRNAINYKEKDPLSVSDTDIINFDEYVTKLKSK